MCGLGVIMHQNGSPVPTVTAECLINAMPTRGPHACGVLVAGPFAPAHHRLSIIDPDPRSDQPMSDHRGRTVVFNGEIYNHDDLRRQLAGGYASRTASDSEVILAAYDRWGDGCFARFNGDWALAIPHTYRRPFGVNFMPEVDWSVWVYDAPDENRSEEDPK